MGDIDDRMKMYESKEAGRRFMPLLPVCALLDGKCFSKFTKGLERPYDDRMTTLMQSVTRFLVAETCASMGYTQSDEITLVWYSSSVKSQIFYDGRIQKMTSVLSAMATAKFNRLLPSILPEKSDEFPLFDCRTWQVPTLAEGANVFLWRELDATRNSVEMAAHHYYSPKECFKKNSSQLQDMLMEKGVNWNGYPAYFKRGTFYQRHKKLKAFSTEELEKLPAKHKTKNNPDLLVERTCVSRMDMPIFSKVANRMDVVFNGADPYVMGTGGCFAV